MQLKHHFRIAKGILLEIAQERTLDSVLSTVVQRNAARSRHTFTGIWLLQPGDICESCPMRSSCSDQTRCLHLAASASRTRSGATNEKFCRIPLGVGEIGRIASTGRQVIIKDIKTCRPFLDQTDWVRSERIQGFNGQPIVYRGEVLGVLGMYYRHTVDVENASTWWRMIADHVGAAIVNARAFEEIQQLKSQLEMENSYLREEVNESQAFGDIVGESPALRNVLRQIDLVAPTDASVLILGESGTGKELVAREIHKRSLRKDRPLIRVNCASIPRELYESEFFGHVRGSFTGAVRDRMGRFETADGGTLFLDEVGEIPLELQGKLLRVLQEGQFERVGDSRSRQVDVRIIAATNRDLKKEAEAGSFRQDLYYRLNVFPIEVAPLRNRKEDISILASHLVKQAAKKLNRKVPRLTKASAIKLQGYSWPGNVRELQNVIERAVISTRSGAIHFDLPDEEDKQSNANGLVSQPGKLGILSEREMREHEVTNVLAALQKTNWKIYGPMGAANLLGIKPTTLCSRIQRFGVKRPRSLGLEKSKPS